MRASTPRLARWIGNVGELSVEAAGLVLSGFQDAWRPEDIVDVLWTRGVIWGDLLLKRADGRTWTATLSKAEGPAIADATTAASRSAVRRGLVEVTARHQRVKLS